MVESTGVDKRIHLGINLRLDHFLTQNYSPFAISWQTQSCQKKPKALLPTRASLKLPEACPKIQLEIDQMPPPNPTWSIDEHDRLVAKLYRVTLR